MAKKRVLGLVLRAMSTPYLFTAWLMEVVGSSHFRFDLNRCIEAVDRFELTVPSVFVDALITAEDHRNELHHGIDPIGMFRAMWVRALTGQVQGASTIEQQFVRVITQRYDRTVMRKLREQVLAVSLVRCRKKRAVASAYLAVAFYGSGCIGIEGLKARFGWQLATIGEHQALEFVAQLKYPRPMHPSLRWHEKLAARTEALRRLR